MDNFQKEIDERANLALSNKFELLLFRLGSACQGEQPELFGINVFKLREIVPMTTITRAAGMKSPLLGMANIRGQLIPVIDLPAVAGCTPSTGLNLLLVTEYARSTQAFAVESVDDIVRLDWNQVHAADSGVNTKNITSIASLNDQNNMALVLDVEQILHDIIPSVREVKEGDIEIKEFSFPPGAVAIVAEDSRLARQMIEQGLKVMGIPAIMHNTGLEAWNKIKQMRQEAHAEGIPIQQKIGLVLTDLEMPEMDGFTLTRNIKSDPYLREVPVVIHSSLSGSANEDHVRKVGANGYVAKFEIKQLSAVICQVLEEAGVKP
ncbi:chemotaxis protein [Erwinia amylovora]|uniref:Chemotaxis signal transduction protein n=3 Tax=Erwinia amylovora TaxID=552 RepID=A0A831A218_ERWAM|nr:chemotaxis protein [Erwinia amylovora]CDK15022.1 putative chemotaxis signal transduction protein [Erwinia amylovora LA635]CDK18390.1 putative chemotaxis signal transduction protein [Erwinia amylovora LA636]CDK21759.1 putative chemotaxis signal transduction protein [Erwinia amylovora LA637]ATZ11343.1 chemotaxis protein CheV [Erwinia amylovora]EKV54221.1 putative chemotaxis signal transduction protein [Erwinia amylovora ACW56400]